MKKQIKLLEFLGYERDKSHDFSDIQLGFYSVENEISFPINITTLESLNLTVEFIIKNEKEISLRAGELKKCNEMRKVLELEG